VLLVHDSKAGAAKYKKFRENLFKNESLAVAIRVFRCLEMDVAKNSAAKEQFGKKLPCFVIFDAKGHEVDRVTLPGYKAKAAPVLKALTKVSKGHGKLPLMTFVKKYRSFLNDLDKLEAAKSTLAKKRERLMGKKKDGKTAKDGKAKKPKVSKSKLKKIEAAEARLAKEEKALLERERKLLAGVKAYSPAARGSRPVARR
jgi:hypothetical protein